MGLYGHRCRDSEDGVSASSWLKYMVLAPCTRLIPNGNNCGAKGDKMVQMF